MAVAHRQGARKVAILGAGIGGLTAALCFARRGWSVEVYEQASALRAFGAGIQITPNGAAVLRALGFDLSSGLKAQAVCPGSGLTGKTIARFDLSSRDYWFFHRADLLEPLGQLALFAGVRFRFEQKLDEDSLPDADLVVGAGGLHCPLRAPIARDGSDMTGPAFTGQVAWRTIVKADHPPEARIWMGPGRHVVTYPLSSPDGQKRVNVVAVEERAAWAEEGWSHPESPSAMRAVYADFAPEVTSLLAKAQDVYLWGLFRHEVAQHWHGTVRGQRVAILGDCAHPTLPFLAQGANLAIEDAWALAALADDLPLFEAERRKRTRRAIEAANANAVNYHLDGLRRRGAHAALGLLGRAAPSLFLNRLGWLYDFDATKAYL